MITRDEFSIFVCENLLGLSAEKGKLIEYRLGKFRLEGYYKGDALFEVTSQTEHNGFTNSVFYSKISSDKIVTNSNVFRIYTNFYRKYFGNYFTKIGNTSVFVLLNEGEQNYLEVHVIDKVEFTETSAPKDMGTDYTAFIERVQRTFDPLKVDIQMEYEIYHLNRIYLDSDGIVTVRGEDEEYVYEGHVYAHKGVYGNLTFGHLYPKEPVKEIVNFFYGTRDRDAWDEFCSQAEYNHYGEFKEDYVPPTLESMLENGEYPNRIFTITEKQTGIKKRIDTSQLSYKSVVAKFITELIRIKSTINSLQEFYKVDYRDFGNPVLVVENGGTHTRVTTEFYWDTVKENLIFRKGLSPYLKILENRYDITEILQRAYCFNISEKGKKIVQNIIGETRHEITEARFLQAILTSPENKFNVTDIIYQLRDMDMEEITILPKEKIFW